MRLMPMAIAAVLLLSWSSLTSGADYNGENIDGVLFSATAFSYESGNFYYVNVMFDGDEATLYFASGGTRTLTLDNEEIDDPGSISAFDYERGVSWDLDVQDLD